MPANSDVFRLMAALKEMHREILAMRKDIDELRDDVKVMGRGGSVHLMITELQRELEEAEAQEDSESGSVHSAPATVSYDRDEN
tara:strand:- start:628 stop:879 length:252 start_codon:yes stop_codon:yes gene_type:complete